MEIKKQINQICAMCNLILKRKVNFHRGLDAIEL